MQARRGQAATRTTGASYNTSTRKMPDARYAPRAYDCARPTCGPVFDPKVPAEHEHYMITGTDFPKSCLIELRGCLTNVERDAEMLHVYWIVFVLPDSPCLEHASDEGGGEDAFSIYWNKLAPGFTILKTDGSAWVDTNMRAEMHEDMTAGDVFYDIGRDQENGGLDLWVEYKGDELKEFKRKIRAMCSELSVWHGTPLKSGWDKEKTEEEDGERHETEKENREKDKMEED